MQLTLGRVHWGWCVFPLHNQSLTQTLADHRFLVTIILGGDSWTLIIILWLNPKKIFPTHNTPHTRRHDREPPPSPDDVAPPPPATIHMHVPRTFWSHGVLYAAYLINRLPSWVLHFKSPLEVLQKQPPNLSHLRVFGCTCFVHIQTSHRDKLDPRAIKCVFLGYSTTQRGYKCYHPS